MRRNCGIVTLLILLLLASLSGCAKYQAKSVFDEAEELISAEQYDQAVEKYFAAAEADPSNTTYKMKLAAGRTRAAAFHIRKARTLVKEGKLSEAQAEYAWRAVSTQASRSRRWKRSKCRICCAPAPWSRRDSPAIRKSAIRLRARSLTRCCNSIRRMTGGWNCRNCSMPDARRWCSTGIELDIASEEPITLRFKQTSVREAFTILGKLSGINFILDEEARGKPITVLLEKGTFAQGLELILQMGGVEKKVLNSKTILIYPNTKDKGKQYQDQVIQTFYLSHIDAKKAVNMLRTMLQLRKIYVHEERNALVIRDTPDAIRLAEQMLKAADRADSEVLFDVEVLAVREGDTLKFGPKLSTYGTTSSSPPRHPTGEFPL